MHNPIFTIISLNINSFKNIFQEVSLKSAGSGKNYFLIAPKELKPREIFINSRAYRLLDWHVSVYEDLNEEEGRGKASYHLTANISENENKLTLRIYFNHFNKILYVNVKNSKGEIIEVGSEHTIYSFANECILSFSNKISERYTELQVTALVQYDKLITTLTEQSMALENFTVKLEEQQAAWIIYEGCLKGLIAHLEQWQAFELQPNITAYHHFIRLQSEVSAKINDINKQLQNASQAQKAPVNENQELLAISSSFKAISVNIDQQSRMNRLSAIDRNLNELKSNSQIPAYLKIPQEYTLLKEKFDLLADDDSVLNCVFRMRELEKLAHQELVRMLLPTFNYNDIKDKQTELEQLIKIINYIPAAQFSMSIANNRPVIVQLLLKHHSYIDLNYVNPKTNRNFLEDAYNNNYFETFKLLLEAGAFCDRYDNNGKTLLMRACEEKRKDEMVALLRAGASNFLRNTQGYTAFAFLTMDAEDKPDLDFVAAFRENCKLFLIDFMQGPEQYRGNALVYACQKNWYEAAKSYLEYGADPNAIRLSDNLTALGICAAKNHVEICKLILANSKHSIDGACAPALRIAR